MTTASAKPYDPKTSLQLLLVFDAFIRLFIWWSPIAMTIAIFTRYQAWPTTPLTQANLAMAWVWGQKLGQLVILYNLIYVAHLVLLRLPIPTPPEGRIEVGSGARTDRRLIYSAVISSLTKARYQPPFPGFLVFHISNLPPMCWLMNPIFGPHSKSCSVVEPGIIDPHMVSVGRNVIIGWGTTIAGHYQERNAVFFKRTVIEDDVLIGGHVAMAGVHVKRGAVIGAGSIVLPGSEIGENEYWSGNPARRRGTLPPPGERAAAPAGEQMAPTI
jgi:hypothetical protein